MTQAFRNRKLNKRYSGCLMKYAITLFVFLDMAITSPAYPADIDHAVALSAYDVVS